MITKNIFGFSALWGCFCLLVACSSASKQADAVGERVEKAPVWTIREGLSAPESVVFDLDQRVYYVSNISGIPTEKDRTGWISKVNFDGQMIQAKWLAGLHAPKGMRIHKGMLWVADIDQVLSVSMKTGKISKRFSMKGAKFLNDIAIAHDGTVYVSDTIASRIYKIHNHQSSVLVAGAEFESPNGLLVVGDYLIVAGWGVGTKDDFSTSSDGHLYRIHLPSLRKELITPESLGHLDGLEQRADGGFIVSDWITGKVYTVSESGEASLLFQVNPGAADLAWNESKKQIIVPRMKEDSVSAYSVD